MADRRTLGKLLVANRGEIALRIIRSARVLGLRTVAVYSEADAAGAHVAAADEARLIGPAEAAQSYLDSGALLAAALASGADAIHPGYGFLSERPDFARAVAAAGLTFVGPSADVMAALGDKVAARQLAMGAGVPVVPGTGVADLAEARKFADAAGFPVILKAAAGGGGRGMRVVGEHSGLKEALEAAAREALSAFGDGRIFIEKYLARPRHVEVQILGDTHGNIVALGERDCSIQRRHQKIVEESPAPGISDAIRARIIDAALQLARVAGYSSAGTVEFLVDGDDFYFLEVNARLQVEHPVTELRFGCDLVAEQLQIAAGERLQPPATPRGHAIECRINAEDAEHDFRPSTGRVMYLNLPAGPGVRVDTHLANGVEISPWYDSLAAKLICYGADREQARARMAAALDEFMLAGVNHSAAFLRDVIRSDPFRRGELSTHFIEEFFPRWRPDREDERAAMVAATLVAGGALGAARPSGQSADDAGRGASSAGQGRSPWRDLAGFEAWGRR